MNRIQKLKKYLLTHNFDSFFVTNEQNITYLTGFKGDSSRLIVTQDRTLLITDGRYVEQANNECDKDIEVVTWLKDIRYNHATYSHFLCQLGVSYLAFEGHRITYSEYQELEKCDVSSCSSVSGVIENFRKIKDVEEIDNLKKAGSISDKALMNVIPAIVEGISELDLVAELEYQLKKCGAHALSFETMVLFGERSSLLHGKPGANKLKHGEHILFDFGAEYNGYHADMSRVFTLGKATKKQKEIYNIVNNVGLQVADMLKHGLQSLEVDDFVRSQIPEKYIEYYYPGIGHGVGLEIHEFPFIKQNAKDLIEEDMVITIEPGLYIPKWGGMRAEDSILIRKNTCISLNNFSRDLIEL